MYDFQKERPGKRYGRVKRGWHRAKIYRAELRNAWNAIGDQRQYIKVDFEIMNDEEYRDMLVSGFFSHNKTRADRRLLNLGHAARLQGDYGDNINAVLRDLWSKELMVFVVHRFKKGQRRGRVEDFRPLPEGSDTPIVEKFDEKPDGIGSTDDKGLPF
jgi:hypothetical protein